MFLHKEELSLLILFYFLVHFYGRKFHPVLIKLPSRQLHHVAASPPWSSFLIGYWKKNKSLADNYFALEFDQVHVVVCTAAFT